MSQGSAGYNAAFYLTGTSTAMTDEACTEVSATVFQITATARRILDHDVAVVVKVATVVQTTGYTVDRLFGIVTFDASKTGSAVTVTANYLPRHLIAKVRTGSVNLSWDMAESGCLGDAGEAHTPTIMRVAADLELVQLVATPDLFGTTSLMDLFEAKGIHVLEFQPSGSGQKVLRARGRLPTTGLASGGQSDIVTGSLSFQGSSEGETLVSYNSI